jgi:hypothetical protein
MEKILAFLSRFTDKVYVPCGIPADKQSHFIYGALTAIICYFIVSYWALLIVMVVAGAKEWYDYKHPSIHTCDIFDWLATTLGAIVTLGVIYGC